MEVHFISGVAIASIVGFGIGCGLMWIRAKRGMRTSIMTESGYLAVSMVSRRALQKLDSGDAVGVKQDLSDAIANFYHSFKSSKEETFASERSQIETLAQSSVILASALRKRKEADEKPVA
jgi:hypothetical protein